MQILFSRSFPLLALALASSIAHSGCSEGSSTPIDTKATIEKAAGGARKANLSEKAKSDDEKAAQKNPKLY